MSDIKTEWAKAAGELAKQERAHCAPHSVAFKASIRATFGDKDVASLTKEEIATAFDGYVDKNRNDTIRRQGIVDYLMRTLPTLES